MSLDAAIHEAVVGAVTEALAPYLRRLADPEPLVYTVPETANVLRTSTNTVRRLLEEGVLPIVPHMGQRVLIPRIAVRQLIGEAGPREVYDLRRSPGTVAAREERRPATAS